MLLLKINKKTKYKRKHTLCKADFKHDVDDGSLMSRRCGGGKKGLHLMAQHNPNVILYMKHSQVKGIHYQKRMDLQNFGVDLYVVFVKTECKHFNLLRRDGISL